VRYRQGMAAGGWEKKYQDKESEPFHGWMVTLLR
jgi:hypothetical protein